LACVIVFTIAFLTPLIASFLSAFRFLMTVVACGITIGLGGLNVGEGGGGDGGAET
jgi:hypothetical protein